MNSPPTELELRIRKVAEQTRFPAEALYFAINSFSQTHAMSTGPLHIDAAEFCWKFHDQAIANFGSSARNQLGSWGITSTNDIGLIVFGLIDEGLMLQNENDELADFDHVFLFEHEFKAFRSPPGARLSQWTLSTLFLLTTITAIALPGALNGGFSGAIRILFSVWFILIGGFCMISGIQKRKKGRFLLVAMGTLLFAAGVIAFAAISANSGSR